MQGMLSENRKRDLTSEVYSIIAMNELTSYEADCLLFRNSAVPESPKLDRASRQVAELLHQGRLTISEGEELFRYVRENLVRFCV
jgi:hypothetical protein